MKLCVTHEVFEDSPAATRRSRTSSLFRFAVGLLPTLFAVVLLVYTIVLPVRVGRNLEPPEELWRLALYQLPVLVVLWLLHILWPNLSRRNCRVLASRETLFPEQEEPQEETRSRRQQRADAKASKEQYRLKKKALKRYYGRRILAMTLRYGLSAVCLILVSDGVGLFAQGITGDQVKFLHILALVIAILAVIGWVAGMVALRKLGRMPAEPPEEEETTSGD